MCYGPSWRVRRGTSWSPGGPQSGKSTLLRTLITAAALTHTPAEVQFYAVDLGGGTLAGAVEVPPRDREVLESWLRSPSMRAVLRARIVLMAADGVGTMEIARRVGVSKPTVISWERRYREEGVGGLDDRAKSGRPREIDEAEALDPEEPPIATEARPQQR
jgi:transposase-like protein